MSTFKVIALKSVRFLANVRIQKPQRIGSDTVFVPGEKAEWIFLKEGDTKDGLGMVLGVEPRYAPNATKRREGALIYAELDQWFEGDLPKDFFGVLRLEISSTSD
jgi:hypothetical protein